MQENEKTIERHASCPECGSKKYSFAGTAVPVGETGAASKIPIKDRKCKECGTVYHPEVPMALSLVFIMLGPCAFFVVLLDLNGELFSGSSMSLTWLGRIVIAVAGIGSIVLGIKMLLMRKKGRA